MDYKRILALHYTNGMNGREIAQTTQCSDTTLTNEVILEHYTHRWKIETMFRNLKQHFGIHTFMVRSALAIDRLMIITVFAGFVFHALRWLVCSR